MSRATASNQGMLAEPDGSSLLAEVDAKRAEAFGALPAEDRSALGQFPTPASMAGFMASMLRATSSTIRLLDPGAGIGSLTAAVVAELYEREKNPSGIEAVAFEIEPRLTKYLEGSLRRCEAFCRDAGINFAGEVRNDDFILAAVELLGSSLFEVDSQRFNCAILNPPYKKIKSDSHHRHALRRAGIETSNLYTAFLALVILLLEDGGELVAITPRSFCNGPYFRPFRELLLRETSIRRIHVFESRTDAFSDDEVLQENIIIHCVKSRGLSDKIVISSSSHIGGAIESREIAFDAMIRPNDAEKFIHIVPDDAGAAVSAQISSLTHGLDDIRLQVSTGPVVDFRSRSFLVFDPTFDTVPLLYPAHFCDGWILWPRRGHKKPNAYRVCDESRKWLIPAQVYVLVKRFSAKEERRRIVASVFDPARIPCEFVALENHLNYFHASGGLSITLAKGLTAFLNSTMVDAYFRQFNGHTQVNAGDLRNLRYPSRAELENLGQKIGEEFPDQATLDELIDKELIGWRKGNKHQIVPRSQRELLKPSKS